MEKNIVKEGVKLAEEELKNDEKMRIKNVVKATLELLQKKETQKKALDDEIRILRKDLQDLKEGRIDRIKERQDLDPKAKEASVIIVKEKIIEKQVPTPMWYIPWIIEIKPQYVPYMPVYCTISDNAFSANTTFDTTQLSGVTFTTNNSDAHMYTSGTYVLENKVIRYL